MAPDIRKPVSALRLTFCRSFRGRRPGSFPFLSPDTVSTLGDFASFGLFISFTHNDTVHASIIAFKI